MPPSLRIRQKWTARKITNTNGSANTCNTYQRSSVFGADDRAAEQQEVRLLGDERGVARERRADRDRPDRELVPGQQVARERQSERQEQQDDADDPVELAWRLVRPGVEHARHVQRHAEDHEVRAPPVDVADEVAEEHPRADVLHVGVGLRGAEGGRRPVEEHQEDAGDREQDEQEERQPSEAERVGQLQSVSLHLHGVQVVEHVVHRRERAVSRRVLVAPPEDRTGPEDRLPDLGVPEPVADLARRRRLQLQATSPLVERIRAITPRPPGTQEPPPSCASHRSSPAGAHSTACRWGSDRRTPSTACTRCRRR